MKKKMRLAALTAAALLTTTSLALAGKLPTVPTTTISKGATTTISVVVSNPSRTEEKAATVNIVGTDAAGRIVANLGAPAVVPPKGSLTVSRDWTAPDYATTLTWEARIVPFREDPIDHSFGWHYPKLQHRMTAEAKNPTTCRNCHVINIVDKDAPMNCYNCHDQKWN